MTDDIDDKLTIKTAATAKFTRVKFVDAEQRVIEGTASTPVTDRAGDIVESLGAEFTLPIPLLLDHRSDQNVGEVFEARVTTKGIRFKARIAKIDKPGAAQDLTNYAWDLVKSGLRKTVSIGFRGLDTEVMANGGLRFKTWELLEISLVSIPANPQALIESIKGDPHLQPPRAAPVAPPIVVDTKAAELKRIAGRLIELEKASIKAARAIRGAGTDETMATVMKQAVKIAEEERLLLLAKQFHLENNLDLYVNKAVAAEPKAPAKWDVKDLPEIEFPVEAFMARDTEKIEAAWIAHGNHWQDKLFKIFRDGGYRPDEPVDLADLIAVRAADYSGQDWAAKRMRWLEDRIGALEAGITIGTRFCGVYQRQATYEAGSLCTSGGSLWHCNAFAAAGVEPGKNPSTWTLCSKGGEPPLSQRETAGRHITGNEAKTPVEVEIMEVVRHDDRGRVLETRKRVVKE